MKFAFSTAESRSSLEKIAATAKELGYEGIEAIAAGGLLSACLSETPPIEGRPSTVETRANHIRSFIDLAHDNNCSLLKVAESSIRSVQNRAFTCWAFDDWLLPLADYAADRGVTLALDTTQSLRTARAIWAILDRLNHPSIGYCLDLLTLARIGESPQVVVPMLNSRIVYVQVSDAKDPADPASDCDLGDGVIPIETTLARLRGIGYSGWVTVKLPGPTDAAEARLSQAIARLREWTTPPKRAKPHAKAAR